MHQIYLHKVTELTKIWDDEGSGAIVNCSIWRAFGGENLYPIGDLFVAGKRENPGFGYLLEVSTIDKNDVLKVFSFGILTQLQKRLYNSNGYRERKFVQIIEIFELWRLI